MQASAVRLLIEFCRFFAETFSKPRQEHLQRCRIIMSDDPAPAAGRPDPEAGGAPVPAQSSPWTR